MGTLLILYIRFLVVLLTGWHGLFLYMKYIVLIFSVLIGIVYYYPLTSHNMTSRRFPAYFFSHGGPTFMYSDTNPSIMGGDWGASNTLQNIGKYTRDTLKPEFVLCVSAHWQSSKPNQVEVAVPEEDNGENSLIYDFYGFPTYMYKEEFHTKSGPRSIAQEIVSTLSENGFDSSTAERGIDHGVWVPFKVAFSKTKPAGSESRLDLDVPLLQISLPGTDDLTKNYEFGQILNSFRDRGLLVFSGMSVHNLRDHMTKGFTGYASPFNNELTEALVQASTGDARLKRLLEFEKSPEKNKLLRQAHPTLEHFLPAIVGAGAAKDESVKELYSSITGALGWSIYQYGDNL